MRYQLLKLSKKKSTKSERIFSEVLKKERLKFRTKVKICGREVDFLIGNVAIDIDCHEQDALKNAMLVDNGYIPVHLSNKEAKDKRYVQNIINKIKKL
jgi:very-short-patch-repair endonuclease